MSYLKEEFYLSLKVFKTAVGLLLILFFIGGALLLWQKNLLRKDFFFNTPEKSPRLQLEFESGKLVKNLKEKQIKYLHSYKQKDIKKQTVKVPIERAIDFLSENNFPKDSQ
ncbi:MAG: hypothetical protein ACXVCP_15255 [Bdellovibrio sp.]